MAVQTESQRGLNLEVADSEMGNPAALPAVLGADGTTQPNLLDSLKAMLAGGRSGPVALTGPEKAAILIPSSAHGTNFATATTAGYATKRNPDGSPSASCC